MSGGSIVVAWEAEPSLAMRVGLPKRWAAGSVRPLLELFAARYDARHFGRACTAIRAASSALIAAMARRSASTRAEAASILFDSLSASPDQ